MIEVTWTVPQREYLYIALSVFWHQQVHVNMFDGIYLSTIKLQDTLHAAPTKEPHVMTTETKAEGYDSAAYPRRRSTDGPETLPQAIRAHAESADHFRQVMPMPHASSRDNC